MVRFGAILLTSVCVSGCVSAVSDGFEAAPEWFQERQANFKGNDYPSFEQAAQMDEAEEVLPWKTIRSDLMQGKLAIDNANAGPVTVTSEDMRAWAAEQKALVAKGEEPY